jgi:hypothetical protein
MEKLPMLVGTEKQIKWAEKIREKALINIENYKQILSEATEDEISAEERNAAISTLDAIAAETSAAVWIDQREWLAGSERFFDFMFSDLFLKYGTKLPDELKKRSRIRF